MSVSFSGVTDITIPQGSVTKITDSNGRVLWEKKSGYELGYPLNFIYAELNNESFTSESAFYSTGGATSISKPTNLTSFSSFVVNAYLGTSQSGWTPTYKQNISAGNKFTACYIVSSTEANNAPNSFHKLTDAKWSCSDFYLNGINSPIAYAFYSGIKVPDSYIPIKFSGLTGSTITVSSAPNSLSSFEQCKTLYESYYDNSKYRSIDLYPYLLGHFDISFTSQTYSNLIGTTANITLMGSFYLKR